MSAVTTSDDIYAFIFCCEHHLVSPYPNGLDSQSSLLPISRIEYMADNRRDLMYPLPPYYGGNPDTAWRRQSEGE